MGQSASLSRKNGQIIEIRAAARFRSEMSGATHRVKPADARLRARRPTLKGGRNPDSCGHQLGLWALWQAVHAFWIFEKEVWTPSLSSFFAAEFSFLAFS